MKVERGKMRLEKERLIHEITVLTKRNKYLEGLVEKKQKEKTEKVDFKKKFLDSLQTAFYLQFITIMQKEEITFTDVVEWIARNSDNTLRMDKLNKLTFPFTSKYTLQSGFAIPKDEMKHYTVEELEEEVNKPWPLDD